MLKIGDFSKLSYISIRMLRYYDKHNMLKPAFIDDETNYRFYSVEQLEVANMIQKLKTLGFNNKIIKEIIQNQDLKSINNHFRKRVDELQSELNKINKVTKELELLIKGNLDIINYNVVKKVIPKRIVMSLRKTIQNYAEESILWNELFAEVEKLEINVSSDCYAIAIYHDLEYKEKDVDIEVQIRVDKFYNDTDKIRFYTMSDLEVASITFNGSYEKMLDVTKSAILWVESNNYELIQPTFCIFHISPA